MEEKVEQSANDETKPEQEEEIKKEESKPAEAPAPSEEKKPVVPEEFKPSGQDYTYEEVCDK